MRRALILAITASVLTQALAVAHLATKDEVLAKVKHDSLRFCSGESIHCEYSVSGAVEGWSALALEVVTGPDGRKGYPVGGHRVYLYSIEGELVQEIPGL